MNGTEAMERIWKLLDRTNRMLGGHTGYRDGQCDQIHKMVKKWSVEPDIIRIDDDIIEYIEKLFEDSIFMKRITAECDARLYNEIEGEIKQDKENKCVTDNE